MIRVVWILPYVGHLAVLAVILFGLGMVTLAIVKRIQTGTPSPATPQAAAPVPASL